MSYSRFLCSHGSGSDPIKNDDFSGGSGMGSNRFRFDNFDNFMNWYNTVRFHESLDTKWYLQTPDIAFWSRLPEGCKLGMFMNRMETELNG